MLEHFYGFEIVHWGYYCLRVFFALSGFLITTVILTHREAMIESGESIGTVARNFYIRRTLRLFPAYYLTLFVVIAFSLTTPTGHNLQESVMDSWGWHFAYLTNFVIFANGSWIGSISHFWTLAVEEQFYLLWFWVVLLADRKWLPRVVTMIFLLGPVFRAAAYFAGWNIFANKLLPASFDFFALGSLLGIMMHPAYDDLFVRLRKYWTERVSLMTLLALAALALAIGIEIIWQQDTFMHRVIRGVLSSFFATWLVYRAYLGFKGPIGLLLNSKAMIHIGKISYGVYLFHAFAPNLLRAIAPGFNAWLLEISLLAPYVRGIRALVLILISIALAELSWRLVELPINRLKKRFSEGVGSHV